MVPHLHIPHTLGLWQKKNPDNPWIRYTEALVKSFLTSERIQFNRVILSNKLKADYVSTLAEMESAVFLAQQGFVVIVEPKAPEKGPDLLAEWDGVPYFVMTGWNMHPCPGSVSISYLLPCRGRACKVKRGFFSNSYHHS